MRTTLRVIAVVSSSAVCFAACPNPIPSVYSGMHCVALIPSAGFPSSTAIPSAVSFWNGAPSCGDSGGAGHDYPRFSSNNVCVGPATTLTVKWITGCSPTTSCESGTVHCQGEWSPKEPYEIDIYSKWGSNCNLVTPTGGTDLTYLLAHEMGHTIGLDDDNCLNGIGNEEIPNDPYVTSKECQAIDEANKEPNEPADTYGSGGGGGGGGICGPSIPDCCYEFPEDPSCSGGGGGDGGNPCDPWPCDYGPVRGGGTADPPPHG